MMISSVARVAQATPKSPYPLTTDADPETRFATLKTSRPLMLAPALAFVVPAVGFGQLTIVPTFDSSITSDPNSAAIISTIEDAIHTYATTFSDPITVAIDFKEMTTGLGQSEWWYYVFGYSTVRSALQGDAKSGDDFTALASLPSGTVNPVNGTTTIALKTADIRALGIPGNFTTGFPGGVDGVISLNTSITNLTRTSTNPSKYDLLAIVEHEIDEVLGLGSGLDFGSSPPVFPEDLFRYDHTGARTFTSSGDDAYFSVDGGSHLLARFNQNSGGDHGDWWSVGAHGAEVQDAFGSPGSQPNLGVEKTALDVIGYDLIIPPVPEPSSLGYFVGGGAFAAILARRLRRPPC